MIYHLIAFLVGFILDLILGDPYFFPHPIRAIGAGISFMEKRFLANGNLSSKAKRARGVLMVFLLLLVTELIVVGLLIGGYWLHPILGCVLESIMTYQILATKSLRVESMKVYKALNTGTIDEARYAVSMIVGRDTANLDQTGVAKAAVETVAENTSDGVIAPMLYLALGGPALGFFYKAVNTCDSMVGYKNDRFLDFGRFAAKFDDVVNFIPARISAFLMVISCVFLGKNYDEKNAWRIFRRDRFNHASPNSAQTESACAGALGVKLAGPASYFGVVHEKPYIGDDLRPVESEDIKRANRLMYMTAFLCMVLCSLLLKIAVTLLLVLNQDFLLWFRMI